MGSNDRIRRRFESRIAPDTHIEAVVLLQKASRGSGQVSMLARYKRRYGLSNSLAPQRHLANHWCVLTENRVLLFAKSGTGLRTGGSTPEYAIDRTEVTLQWADFVGGMKTRMRLVHLTTTDMRMSISQTLLGHEHVPGDLFDEADRLIHAFGERATWVDLSDC